MEHTCRLTQPVFDGSFLFLKPYAKNYLRNIRLQFFPPQGLTEEKAQLYCIIFLQKKISYFVFVLCLNYYCFGNWNARSFVSDDSYRLYFKYKTFLIARGRVC
jgi:hypothetical protein